MQTIADLVSAHDLFREMCAEDIKFIAGCARLRRFKANAFLARENEPADWFYLLLQGHVVIETHQNHQRSVPLLTLGPQEVVGWSWLFPPYIWHFDARSVTPLRSIEINGRCLREKCESDPRLGFDLMRRLAMVMMEHLHATRFQLLDVYSDDQRPPAGTSP